MQCYPCLSLSASGVSNLSLSFSGWVNIYNTDRHWQVQYSHSGYLIVLCGQMLSCFIIVQKFRFHFSGWFKFIKTSGWLGGAKVSCIFCHRGVQLILAYSWARPAILVAGKGRVMFLFLLYLHFHSCSSSFPVPLFHLFCYLFCLFSPFLWETTQNDPQGLTCR